MTDAATEAPLPAGLRSRAKPAPLSPPQSLSPAQPQPEMPRGPPGWAPPTAASRKPKLLNYTCPWWHLVGVWMADGGPQPSQMTLRDPFPCSPQTLPPTSLHRNRQCLSKAGTLSTWVRPAGDPALRILFLLVSALAEEDIFLGCVTGRLCTQRSGRALGPHLSTLSSPGFL